MKDKNKMIDYLRLQAYWANQAAEELEEKGYITCGWCLDIPINPEYEQEIEAREAQGVLNYEHTEVNVA